MRQMFLLSILSCVLMVAGTAHAKGHAKGKGKGMSGNYQGTIVSVHKISITIDIGTDRSHNIIIAIDRDTAVTGGGKQGTIDDLAAGQIVSVEVANNKAKKIDVTGVKSSE